MKIIAYGLFVFLGLSAGISDLCSQTSRHKVRVVIEGKKYVIGFEEEMKIDPMWIERIDVIQDNGIFMYLRKEYKEQELAAIGLRKDTTVYQTVTSYPKFQYGKLKSTEESLKAFFLEKFRLPAELKGKEFDRNMYVIAIVEKDGKLSNIKVNKSSNEILTNAVIQILSAMPAWTPAKIGQSSVRYKTLFAINGAWLQQ